LTPKSGGVHAAASIVSRGRREKFNHKEITAYPTMYERVVNQLFSTESKSACSLCEACGQVGFERCLTGETSVREKVDEPHVVNAIVYLREPLLREEEGRTGEGGGFVDRGL
jgi:hypothetical protein